jgi:hypothetical protein
MRLMLALAVTAMLAAGTSTVAAQQSSPAAFEPGRRAIEVEVPEGGGSTVGIWWVRSPESQLGIRTGFSVTTVEAGEGSRQSNWSVSVGPAIKRHIATVGPVVPYWRAGAAIGAAGASGTQSPRSLLLSGQGGLGADWFPVDRVAFGAHVGIRGDFNRQSAESQVAGRVSQNRFTLGTATSAVTMKLYF